MAKKLSGILKVFTKARKELEDFVKQNEVDQIKVADQIADLVIYTEELQGEKDSAFKALSGVNNILGDE